MTVKWVGWKGDEYITIKSVKQRFLANIYPNTAISGTETVLKPAYQYVEDREGDI